MSDQEFMSLAIEQARLGRDEGGIPIGAVLAGRDGVLGAGRNRRIQEGSPVLHAELDALASAGRLAPGVYRSSTLFTTLSPCAMCSGAILLYQIPRVVIGEHETFLGEEDLLRSRGVEVVLAGSGECVTLMRSFTAGHPDLWAEDIGRAGDIGGG
jgi:cytosine/creatinine deaminase